MTSGDLLPVMFFVHGGAFSSGNQIFMDGVRLADQADIIVVAINYRVGPLGESESSHSAYLMQSLECCFDSFYYGL